tara:strand:+ start:5181 stop:5642 length:462 start_codon:yes stop_codon:yes gene_type:complete
MTMRATYGGLFSVINSREVNRLREIIDRCGLEMGAIGFDSSSISARGYNPRNPMQLLYREYDNDFTQLPLKQFVNWLRQLEEHLSSWYRDKQKQTSEAIRWSQSWVQDEIDEKDNSGLLSMAVNEDTGELKLASDCLTDLKRIRRNVEQRYRR